MHGKSDQLSMVVISMVSFVDRMAPLALPDEPAYLSDEL